jgi:predicted amidohydrolase YtcJ
MPTAGLILEHTNIINVERGSSATESIAIEGELIQAAGPDNDIAALRSDGTHVINLTGKTVVPGFIDSHAHLAATGLSLIELDLREARSVREVQDLVAGRAVEQPVDTLLRGWNLYENLLCENRFPTRHELDAVAPDHYVRIFREDGHSSVVNTKMLEHLGYDTETPGADVVDGELTGVLRADAQKNAGPRVRELETMEMREQAMRAAGQRALEVGLTTVQTLEGSDTMPHEEYLMAARLTPTLPVHTVMWYQTTYFQRLEGLDLPRIGGCIMLDGAPGSYTGALFGPYSDNPTTTGVLYFADEDINGFVLEAHHRGYQIAVHATCQRAIEQAIRAYEKALDAYPKEDHRMRIEHGYGLPTADQFERMGKRGIILSTQPAFLHYRMDMYYKRFGPRWRQVHPHRLALDHGVTIAGGSDSFVTPLYPLLGIHCAVNHPVEEQRVGVREALRWFTINGAFAAFEEDNKGTITPGKLADLTVLERDILTENALTIKDIPVVMTIVGGKIHYVTEDAKGSQG